MRTRDVFAEFDLGGLTALWHRDCIVIEGPAPEDWAKLARAALEEEFLALAHLGRWKLQCREMCYV